MSDAQVSPYNPNVRPRQPIPPERRMICTRTLFLGPTYINAGEIVDVNDWIVRRFPAFFAPAPPEAPDAA